MYTNGPFGVCYRGHRQVVDLVWCCEDWSLWRLRRGTRATGIRSRSSGTRCGCITVSRRKNRLAATALRRDCTNMSSTSPCDRAPQVIGSAVDFHEDVVEVAI